MKRRAWLLVAAARLRGERRLDLGAREAWCAADGSEFPAASWKVDGGVFQAIGGLETFQDIRTRAEFGDFDFQFEWRMGRAGNSGVKYLIEKSDKWQPKGIQGYHIRARGHEFQLVDDDSNDDAQKGGVKQCGALYNTQAPVKKAVHRIGEWNSGRLVKQGRVVEHWVNGERLVRYELEREYPPTAIALQNHHDDVWFRGLAVLAG